MTSFFLVAILNVIFFSVSTGTKDFSFFVSQIVSFVTTNFVIFILPKNTLLYIQKLIKRNLARTKDLVLYRFMFIHSVYFLFKTIRILKVIIRKFNTRKKLICI